MAVAANTNRDLAERLSDLYSIVFDDKPWQDASLNIDALLDALVAVQRECSTLSLDYLSKFGHKYSRLTDWIRSLRVNANDFEVLSMLAKGAYGKVFLVRSKLDRELYAMKTLKKSDVLKTDNVYFFEERNIMAHCQSTQWLTSLQAAFQDDENLYLVMDFLPGGDVVTLLENQDDATLNEDAAKFYIAETVLAIEELHNLDFIHRDIKPHNLLIDKSGHLKLADFGSCIRVGASKTVDSNVTVGTPDYVSPEVLRAQEGNANYGKEVDWWSIGIVLYETLFGDPPFYAESITATYSMIMNHSTNLQFPDDIEVSEDAKDLIRMLLANSEERLGRNGAEEVKNHPWFSDIDWNDIRNQIPPFVPTLKSADDTSYFPEVDDEEGETNSRPVNARNFVGLHLPFIGYTFYRDLPISARQGLEDAKGESIREGATQHGVNGVDAPDRASVAKIKALEDDLEMAKVTISGKDDIIASAQSDRMALLEEIDKFKSEIRGMHKKEEERVQLEKEKLVAEIESKELRAQLDAINQQNSGLRQRLDSRGDRDARLQKEHQETLKALQSRNSELEAHSRSLQQSYETTKNESRAQLEDQATKIRELERELQSSRRELEFSKNRAEESASRLQAAENSFKSELDEAVSAREELRQARDSVTEELNGLRRTLDAERKAARRMSIRSFEVEERRGRRDIEVRSLESKVQVLVRERDELLERIREDSQRAGGERQIMELQKSLEEQQKLRREILEELAMVMKDKNSLELELDSIKKQLDIEIESHQQTTRLSEQLDALLESEKASRKRAEEKFNEVESELHRLGDELRSMRDENDGNVSMRIALEEQKESERRDLQEKVDHLQDLLDNETRERQIVSDKLESLSTAAQLEAAARVSAESLLNEAHQERETALSNQRQEQERMDELMDRNQELESTCVSLKKSLAVLRLDLENANKIQNESTIEGDNIRARLVVLEAENQSHISTNEELRGRIRELEKELESLSDNLRRREEELIDVSRKLNVDSVDRPSKRIREEAKETAVRLQQANIRIQALEQQVIEAQQERERERERQQASEVPKVPQYTYDPAESRGGHELVRSTNHYSVQKVGRRTSLMGFLPRIGRPGSLSELREQPLTVEYDLHGFLRLPRDPRSLRRGWKKRFVAIRDGSLIVLPREGGSTDGPGVPLANFKVDLFMARAAQPQELFHLTNKEVDCTFIILTASSKSSRISPVAAQFDKLKLNNNNESRPNASPSRSATAEELSRRIEWILKRIDVEERVRQGAENYLAVAPKAKVLAAQRQVEAASERISSYRAELDRLEVLHEDASHASAEVASFKSSASSPDVGAVELQNEIENLERQIRAEKTFMQGARRIASVSRRPASIVADKEISAAQQRLDQLETSLKQAKQQRSSMPSDEVPETQNNSHSRTSSRHSSFHHPDDSSGHVVRRIHSNIPNTCFACHDVVLGPRGDGLECTVCRLIMHQGCLTTAKLSCSDACTLQAAEPIYLMAADPEERRRWLAGLNAVRNAITRRRSSVSQSSSFLHGIPPTIHEDIGTPRSVGSNNLRPLPSIPFEDQSSVITDSSSIGVS